jgi:hypothetical protein
MPGLRRDPVSSASSGAGPTARAFTHSAKRDSMEKSLFIGSSEGLPGYTCRELRRVLDKQLGIDLDRESQASVEPGDDTNRVIAGTRSLPAVAALLEEGTIALPGHPQGYVLKSFVHAPGTGAWTLVVAGEDEAGTLYGVRDLEHYGLPVVRCEGGAKAPGPLERSDYPRIEHRGHWVWGCNMPAKEAWIENMSRWKLNEVIHWDNDLTDLKRARQIVAFAHSRGIRFIWGFGWGWCPDWNHAPPGEFDRGVGEGVQMCSSSAFNREYFRRELLRKLREEYVPTGCDGVYFQSFTEVPKCQCDCCRDKTMGQLVMEFANPIIDAVLSEFPYLWISCGIHANFGEYEHMRDLDERVNIYWENCDSGTSCRGPEEDFGYIYKKIPYIHGFSDDCPVDPPGDAATLQRLMGETAHLYHLRGTIDTYRHYLAGLQKWGRNLLGKPSCRKHASTVADGSVFSARTPFMHAALAEAQWNPEADTNQVADMLVDVLGLRHELVREGESNACQHEALGRPVVLANAFSEEHPGRGPGGLTDGHLADHPTSHDPAWQGFHKTDLVATIDMGRVVPVRSLACRFLHESRTRVWLPKSVTYSASQDGSEFTPIATMPPDTTSLAAEADIVTCAVDGLDLDARYLRVQATQHGDWLLADQFQVNPLMVG